jgi:DNA-binding transcriptional regulator YiaG
MKKSTERIDGLRLRLARVTVGLTMGVAAKKLHTSSMSISQWEHEKVHATPATV